MKISINDAFKIAKEKLPSEIYTELVFSTDDLLHRRIIYAIASEAGTSKTSFWLTSFGMASSFTEAKALVDKCIKEFSSKPSEPTGIIVN